RPGRLRGVAGPAHDEPGRPPGPFGGVRGPPGRRRRLRGARGLPVRRGPGRAPRPLTEDRPMTTEPPPPAPPPGGFSAEALRAVRLARGRSAPHRPPVLRALAGATKFTAVRA